MYEELKQMFDGKFWTRDNELVEALEKNGLEVIEINYEGICLVDPDEEEEVYIKVGRANTTVWMVF